MKIVLLTSKLNFKTAGGSVMDLHLKAKGLVDEGHTVTVVTAFSRANIILDPLPYAVIEENTDARDLLNIHYHAYKIIKKHQQLADVIYIEGQNFIYGGGLYRVLGGNVPIVAFFNTQLNRDASKVESGDNSLFSKFKKAIRPSIEMNIGVWIANHCDTFIFNTPNVQAIYKKFGYDIKKSVVIEDYVDMKGTIDKYEITNDHIVTRQSNRGTIAIFSTGRILREKGFDLIVKAFALLPKKEMYHVTISGDGPDKERVISLVKEMQLEKYFTFPGWVDKEILSHYFLTSQIFIFPKWWVEYGSALLTEALAFGLPCIIPGGGALEWLTLGESPTFHNDDPGELASRIDELGNSENLRISVAQKSLKRAETLDYRILSKKLSRVLTQTAEHKAVHS